MSEGLRLGKDRKVCLRKVSKVTRKPYLCPQRKQSHQELLSKKNYTIQFVDLAFGSQVQHRLTGATKTDVETGVRD